MQQWGGGEKHARQAHHVGWRVVRRPLHMRVPRRHAILPWRRQHAIAAWRRAWRLQRWCRRHIACLLRLTALCAYPQACLRSMHAQPVGETLPGTQVILHRYRCAKQPHHLARGRRASFRLVHPPCRKSPSPWTRDRASHSAPCTSQNRRDVRKAKRQRQTGLWNGSS